MHAATARRRWSLATATLALIVPCVWAWWSPPGANDLVGGDEGYYGVMARNVLADPTQALGPSLTPLGPPGDKPPLVPVLLAASLRVSGAHDWALRWPFLLFAAIALAGAGAIARAATGSGAAGFAATLLLASLPWFADASRVVAAEGALAALGICALVVLGGGAGRQAVDRGPSSRRALAAGALLGAAFLCKLWLVAPFVIAAAFAMWPLRARGALALGLGFALVGSLQLVLVQAFRPGDFAHWWSVYSSFSLASRATGEGYADYWLLPASFYARTLAQAFVLLLPLVAFGIAAALARIAERGPRLVLGWALGAVLLSAFRVKAGAYLYPIVPAFAVLAALGAHALATRARASAWVPLLVALATSPAVLARGGGAAPATTPWIAAWGLAMPALLAARLGRFLAGWSATLLVAFAAVGGFVREAQRMPQRYHATGYREIAAALAPHLAGSPASRLAILTPEAPAIAFYTFHRAGYWDTPYERWTPERAAAAIADTNLRAFIVDPTGRAYGGAPDSAMLAWLEREAVEITPRGVRVGSGEAAVRAWVRAGGTTETSFPHRPPSVTLPRR